MWSQATAEDARNVLKSNDVVVTNQGDKDQQLDKTINLNDEVRAAFDAKSFIRLNERGSAASELQTLGFSLEVIGESLGVIGHPWASLGLLWAPRWR